MPYTCFSPEKQARNIAILSTTIVLAPPLRAETSRPARGRLLPARLAGSVMRLRRLMAIRHREPCEPGLAAGPSCRKLQKHHELTIQRVVRSLKLYWSGLSGSSASMMVTNSKAFCATNMSRGRSWGRKYSVVFHTPFWSQ